MQKSFARRLRDRAVVTSVILALVHAQGAMAQPSSTTLSPNDNNTKTPIKHVIVIIGENRTFDHVFGTYQPRPGQSILNILSEGIVKTDGTPGPNYSLVANQKFGRTVQHTASDTSTYSNSPTIGSAYTTLPPPGAAGAPTVASDTAGPPFADLATAANYEYGLYPGDLHLITTGATGLSSTHAPDTRITYDGKNDSDLPNGPFQLTGPTLPYDSYTGSPVHRFYQMWQQTDCSTSHATGTNPTGCISDLFPWVETTVDTGNNGAGVPSGYNIATYTTAEGATSMAFFNMSKGDVPYFKSLADSYTISDNFHQSVMGGTGANHLMFGYADGVYYNNPLASGPDLSVLPPGGQIENPDPNPTTNNIYKEDGYGYGASPVNGGSYSNCSQKTPSGGSSSQPGVPAVVAYLESVSVNPNCENGAYYLLNNYNPAYVGNGTLDPSVNGVWTIPPTYKKHIGNALDAQQVSWTYYGESWNDYVTDPNPATNPAGYLYCNICNPFAYSASTMTGYDAALGEWNREAHIKDTTDLYNGIANGVLPAVSIVKPNALNDGHPASSKLDLFESFTKKIITELQANKELWATTAVFITFDEGGGYWDSGYIQPVDFFGDGTRIPLIVVSPYSMGGRVVHTYGDHVSIDKFIEYNWKMSPITNRSRDNLPNPNSSPSNPYVPTNRPAIGNLADMFDFL